MPKSKDNNTQICQRCKKRVKDTAAIEIHGKIKWVCYHCYKELKD